MDRWYQGIIPDAIATLPSRHVACYVERYMDVAVAFE